MADRSSVGCVCTKVHWALVWSQAIADGVALYISALPESAGTKKLVWCFGEVVLQMLSLEFSHCYVNLNGVFLLDTCIDFVSKSLHIKAHHSQLIVFLLIIHIFGAAEAVVWIASHVHMIWWSYLTACCSCNLLYSTIYSLVLYVF